MAQKKESVSFRKVVPANTNFTGLNALSATITGDATIEKISVRFYPGQQKSLHVRPYVKMKNEEIVELIRYPAGTDQYLSGDNDSITFDVGLPVSNLDLLMVDVTNTDTVNAYSLVVDIEVDYYGGQNRVV